MLPVLLAFLAGFVTIFSPCVLPILPLILSNTLGGKSRPWGVFLGFVTSFTLFTLFLSATVSRLGLDPQLLHTLAIFLIAFFGLTLLMPQLQQLWEKFTSPLANKASSIQTGHGFFGGLVFGATLALVWTPCVGPILASVISLTITGQITLHTFALTLSYSVGTGIAMLLVLIFGKKVFQKFLNPEKLQQFFGALMILVSLAMLFGWDKKFQTALPPVPSFVDNLSLPTISTNAKIAPDFPVTSTWLNTPKPLSLSNDLKGKVVLVDFWTYTCINCIRTLPYVQKWQETYAKQGFTVIGVHSPEFEFEKNTANVQKAIAEYKLTYPVVQDNDFKIWNSYDNQYWPAHYLIDKNGRIVYTHFGEGKYVETENKIRELLQQEAIPETLEASPSRQYLTNETYLGFTRSSGPSATTPPDQDQYYLSGDWQSQGQYIQSQKNSKLELNFSAKNVYLVLESVDKPAKLIVSLNGKYIQEIIVDSAKKYDIISLPQYQQHQLLQLDFDSGIRAFAFTFGG